ncbi:hypothetical protein Cgig2_028593 [Carnegiea gigantea]|uniref:CST complex subunit CTC1 n=1 Tax=Carnegiea gigantea TaxID=171969 RepID=A0A9Q1QEG5_9CARY|nr:hypothetical protein Cgig2_028593 [Carnegiea gigantea]
MEKAQVIPISDLLRRRRPISGTSSLLTSQPHAAALSVEGDAKTLNPNSSSGTKVLKSLSEPSVIIGTLSLPKLGDSLSSGMNSCQRCLSFSDSSASACCDVLDFDFRMIGRKIRVVSWNFTPSKMCGGLVEIIKWEFAEGSISSVDSFPLYSGGVNEDCRKARHNICGLLESVSPVSLIPCTMGSNGNEENLHSFIAEVSSCDCELCNGKDCKKVGPLVERHDGHAFSQTNFVYFNGPASCWHPAMLRLIGNVVSFSGLRKKLVYVGKEEAQLMFVTSNVTCLNYRKLHNKDISYRCVKTNLEGNGELGMYVGVVRGVYMQSMIVELDKEVWLLLMDQLLVVPHSLRVGAVLLLRNVHIVNPRFPWSKMLILGACHKTSISTVSFSSLETG